MAKPLVNDWRDALALVPHCTVEAITLNNPYVQILLRDPAGQRFGVQITSVTNPAINGNILTLEQAFAVVAVEFADGDRFAGVKVGERTG